VVNSNRSTLRKHTVTYKVGGSVTNNTTRVRIGYRIYSLWRFTAATQATITMSTLALLASQIPLTELHCADVSLRGVAARTGSSD
jgi:hypothetical protein